MTKANLPGWIVAACAVTITYIVADTAKELKSRIDKLIEAITNPVDTIKSKFRKTTEDVKPRNVFKSIRSRFSKKED